MAKKDFSQIAFSVVQRAIGDAVDPTPTPRQVNGAKGGLKGGKTRMANLTDIERTELAKKAASSRWKKP